MSMNIEYPSKTPDLLEIGSNPEKNILNFHQTKPTDHVNWKFFRLFMLKNKH